MIRNEDICCVEPPKILQRPDSVIQINRGESISIKCGFRGRPEPIISWLHNGQEITINGSPATGKKKIFLDLTEGSIDGN